MHKPSNKLPNTRVVAWLEPPIFGKFERFNSMLKPGYFFMYFFIINWIKKALKNGAHFDLIHQLSPLALRYPSPGANLNIPLVFGPLGGSLTSPKAFEAEMGGTSWYVKFRKFDALRLKYDPWLRSSYRNANLILGVADYVQDHLRDIGIQNFKCMSEVGVENLPEIKISSFDGGILNLLFVVSFAPKVFVMPFAPLPNSLIPQRFILILWVKVTTSMPANRKCNSRIYKMW